MTTLFSEAHQRERIPAEIHASADAACRGLAAEIAALIRERAAQGRHVVLGLATGSTPVRLYRELIRLHREDGLSFRNVLTFNLDEYHGLSREHPESYWRFMHEQLFNHIDVSAENIHVPDGTVPRAEAFARCRAYEEKIRAAGGLDLQILGIGRTGHIGFNEPGSGRDSRTRLVTLDALTRRDAARDFLGEANVPRHAITMGVGTILDARKIVLLAWGEAKARVIAQAVEGAPVESLPASFLQGHPDVRFLLDPAAGSELTRIKHPWLVGPVEWTPALARRAVTWLSLEVGRPVLKLLDEHYGEHGMADLLTEQGPAYNLNIRIFNEVQHTITGWPGGKPNADDTHRPERASPHPKRVIVFSPEPSDEMLGMGGTLSRLVEQGHAVTVVYLTSGNLAVPDEEAAVAADLVLDFVNGSAGAAATPARNVRAALAAKLTDPQASDTPDTRRLKGLLRRGEARAALRLAGLSEEAGRFLDLPFYENGRYRQFRAGPADIAAVAGLLAGIKPHQILATGEGQDPSSVGAVCFEVLRAALAGFASEPWRADCRVWLYRTPDKAWAAHEIDMAVPLSPAQLARKVQVVYQHKSQRSQTPAAGPGLNEAWQQAEAAARDLAATYDALGLAEYEAIEAFRRWLG
ncbi:MAG: glucosamine-6-phosphate deaminase [Rariglobus sp.]|jgi:glucosamine-6-phosphate deaminase|nr:glucosamine-6-phosphate deaminase [Rariglobus sp.]